MLRPLEQLRFYLVGYGCTTCIGNSGPLPAEVSQDDRRQRPGRGQRAVAAIATSRAASIPRCGPTTWPRRRWSSPTPWPGKVDIDFATEPLGKDNDGQAGLPEGHLADAAGGRRCGRADRCKPDMFTQHLQRRVQGRRALEGADGAGGRPLRLADRKAPTSSIRPISRTCRRQPRSDRRYQRTPACWPLLGDSITTDHISPAGSIKKDSPAGKYLIEQRRAAGRLQQYGARRGNHEVMIRGTFANVRLKNQLAPGTEGGFTRHLPDGGDDDDLRRLDASTRRKACRC